MVCCQTYACYHEIPQWSHYCAPTVANSQLNGLMGVDQARTCAPAIFIDHSATALPIQPCTTTRGAANAWHPNKSIHQSTIPYLKPSLWGVFATRQPLDACMHIYSVWVWVNRRQRWWCWLWKQTKFCRPRRERSSKLLLTDSSRRCS